MKCIICNKEIADFDKYFLLIDCVTSSNPLVMCDDCATITTVMDMYMRGNVGMTNAEDNAIEVDWAVMSEPENSDDIHSEYAAKNPVPEQAENNTLNKQQLNSEYGTITAPNYSPLVVLFTDVSDRKRYYIFPDVSVYEKEAISMYNLCDVHFCTVDEIPSDYKLELDFRDNSDAQ